MPKAVDGVPPTVVEPATPLYLRYVIQDSLLWSLAKRFLGCLCYLAAIAGMLGCIVGWDAIEAGRYREDEAVIVWSVAIGGMVGWPLLATLATRLVHSAGITSLRGNRRAPLLYLRSFSSDRRWIESPADLFWLLLHGGRYETYEWSLAKAVRDIGPLIAIGKPGEMLPPLGAARVYVDGEHWQKVIEDLVPRSRLVLLRAGKTEGFWWEVEHLVATTDPQKVVIFLPPKDRGTVYEWLREQAVGILPQPLPEYTGLAMFIAFGPGWEPRLLGAGGPSGIATLRRLVIGSPSPGIREALNGALVTQGIRPRALPLQWREWVIVLCAVIIVSIISALIVATASLASTV
jgi:hypothetical protein